MKNLQQRLRDKGFDPGWIDGVGGPRTATAFQDFLSSEGFDFRVTATPALLTATGPLSGEEAPWIHEAKRVMGRHEIHDNSFLSSWLRKDGRFLGDPSKLPWCGDFVDTAIRLALPNEPFSGRVRENPYLARNWSDFGVKCDPSNYAIAYFWRGSPSGTSGHIGFLVGESDTDYFVLGGNQSNKVSVTRLSKNRLLGTRWPITAPNQPKPLPHMSNSEMPRSVNEF